MVETAAHQVDHVFPKVPVRQWVLLEAHGVENMKTGMVEEAFLSMVQRIFMKMTGKGWKG